MRKAKHPHLRLAATTGQSDSGDSGGEEGEGHNQDSPGQPAVPSRPVTSPPQRAVAGGEQPLAPPSQVQDGAFQVFLGADILQPGLQLEQPDCSRPGSSPGPYCHLSIVFCGSYFMVIQMQMKT